MGEKSSFEGSEKMNGISAHQCQTPITPVNQVNSGFNMSFLPYQSSHFGQTPNAFGNMHTFDGNCFPMQHQSMSYMNMLTNPLNYHHVSQSSPNTSSGSNKRSPIEDVTEQSPNKENQMGAPKKKKQKKVNKKGVGHMWWQSKHDDILIPYLAKLAKEGFKVDKSFKNTAFNMAAAYLNNYFGTAFTNKHVMHHMKTLRTRFYDMQRCRNLSGAGWDEKTKTITMDGASFDRWKEENNNCKLKDYINKPLVFYEELAIIIGDDQARGDHAKDVAQNLGADEPIILGDDEDNYSDIQCLDEDESQALRKEKSTTNLHIATSVGKAKKHIIKEKRAKTSMDTQLMQQMVEEVKGFSASIKSVNMHWTEKLAKSVFAYKDKYPIEILEKFFDKLFESEHAARHFNCKSEFGQRALLDEFMKKLQVNSVHEVNPDEEI